MGLRRFDRSLLKQKASPGRGPLEDLLPQVAKGRVIPVISNAFRIEQIFRQAHEESLNDEAVLSIYEQLIQVWADEIGYPAEDSHNLARVAKFFITEQLNDTEAAKSKYLAFLSSFLLAFAEDENPDDVDLISDLEAHIQTRKFSEIARELDYPRFPDGIEDPLRLLARFPMPIYITTSYFDSMERALEAEGKRPHTQIIFWSGQEYATKPEHQNDPHFQPSVDSPVIYHLFGLEDYPRTLVMSEDDYLNFLISAAKDKDTQNPVIPLALRMYLDESVLLLLGYNSGDWELKVLDTFIHQYRKNHASPRGILTQSQSRVNPGNEEKSRRYFADYFDRRQFDIEWTSPEAFISKLWDAWNQWNPS